MRKIKRTYTAFQKVSAVFLMLTLLWLTVSTPFVLAAQQEIAKQEKMQTTSFPDSNSEDENSDSGNNNIEEKVPNTGNGFSEEYLHEHYSTHFIASIISSYQKLDNSDTYIAYHGELHCPPPNVA